MLYPNAPHRRTRAAFTLFELLMVMGIVLIIGVLAIPALSSVKRSTALTRAEDEILGELSLARQHAISVNRDVEVRFYRVRESAAPSAPWRFRAVQAYTYDAAGAATPLRIVRMLPREVVIDSGTTLSTLLAAARKKAWSADDPQPVVPGYGTDYEAWAFRFRPEGGTDLTPFPATPWFITLHDAGLGDSLATPPANYASIVVDPVSGQMSSFRP